MTTTRSVQYGGEAILFELVRTDRRTLGVMVRPDGTVTVRAPRRVSEADVLARVAAHARWILSKQRYFAQFAPRTPPRRYVGGETHLYLGRQYRLAIERGPNDDVRLDGGWFRVTVSGDASPDHVKKLLDAWYLRKTRRWLVERFAVCWEAFPSDGHQKPGLQLRRMRTYWGSMSARGTLSIQPDLIRAPRECFDYVIFHELCHLVHPNHGPEFRRLLDQVVPDWERRKRRLESALS